jgi:beta-glucosidase
MNSADILMESDADAAAASLLSKLSLEQKVRLLTGADLWSTWAEPAIGLRRIVVSDGPAGVRGEVWDERHPSLNLPSPTAMASAWDPALARQYGVAAAMEARRKGVDVVLGPTINLHRSPVGGRHFEAFSEDPFLTGELAAAYVLGAQANGVGATPKHYVANDFENERFTADVRVDARTLRELYLLPFEKAIAQGHAWLVMSAYNSINGTTATENDLLRDPLRTEWCFDGVVISDWTAVRSLRSAAAEQDLVMPGPDGPWGEALLAALRLGEVDEDAVDRKVLRLLHLAQRVGALEGFTATPPAEIDGVALARDAGAAGTVLLENRGELPWDPALLASVAVIGDNAAIARTQGGGSATVVPEYVVSPLDGLRAALPGASVSYSRGAVVHSGVLELPLDTMTNPETDEPGLHVRFLDRDGTELFTEDRLSSSLYWFGGTAPTADTARLEIRTRFTPAESGAVRLGFALVGRGRLFVDNTLLLDAELLPDGDEAGAFLSPPSTSTETSVSAGVAMDVRLVYDIADQRGTMADALSTRLGVEPVATDEDALIAAAADAARSAAVALVVVGTNSVVESEGYDRTTLALPGRQDDLVRAVADANPRTVVLVNAGSPVLMPWRDDVAAVLVGYFGGQEFGHAVADVLLGAVEPGGRLPTTWPAAETDVPVLESTPVNGVVEYTEGIHIGYRAWLRQDAAPAYWFGHGLGYADIVLTGVTGAPIVRPGEDGDVTVHLANRSARAGKQVVQVYAERAGSHVDRPARWLVGFAPAHVEAGAEASVRITVSARMLAFWDDGWQYEAGDYRLRIGTSVVDLPLETTLRLDA